MTGQKLSDASQTSIEGAQIAYVMEGTLTDPAVMPTTPATTELREPPR
jgi:hypothetical protein